MRSDIEQCYADQGYRLPDSLTWADVEKLRSEWSIDPVLVPVAVAPGCIGWGVPFIDGVPLRHP